MEDVRYIEIKGDLEVDGVINFNTTGKWFSQGESRDNHKFAKKDNFGRDYTSKRCLTYLAFSDLQPRQPSSKERGDYYPEIAGSIVGLLRGCVATDLQVQRSSSLKIMDAYTKNNYLIAKPSVDESDEAREIARFRSAFFDQGGSSKPKETGLVSQSKKKQGQKAQDTSLFSHDNCGPRRQDFKAVIVIENLQMLALDSAGFRIVQQDDEDRFLKALKETFKALGQKEPTFDIQQYVHRTSVVKTDLRGILLSQEQQHLLISHAIERLIGLRGYRQGARLEADPTSFQLVLSDGRKKKTIPLKDVDPNDISQSLQTSLAQALSGVSLHAFYKAKP